MAVPFPLEMKDTAALIIVMVNFATLVSANSEGQATAGTDWISLYCLTEKLLFLCCKSCSIDNYDYIS